MNRMWPHYDEYQAKTERRDPRRRARAGVTPAQLRRLCLKLSGAEETFPFGPETSVFKVGGKMFALAR